MDLARRHSFLLPLSLLGCRKDRTAESAAAEFIDRYYIEKDHARALGLTVGPAAERVRTEQKMVAEAGGASGGSPRVFYQHVGTEPAADSAQLRYTLTIDVSGFKLKKDVRLNAVKHEGAWKIAAFVERDLPAE